MNTRSAGMWWGLAAVLVAALLFVPLALSNADEAANGFEGFVQSGTCAQPAGEFKADLESDDNAYDVEPYVAVGADGEDVTLGYNGSPGVPGFGLAAIYTDQAFSLVIADPDSDEAVACGDILRPAADKFREAGVAVVQLLPVGSSDVGGIAAIQRTSLQRELDITPTRVRIVLSTEPVSIAGDVADGYEGYVRGGYCDAEPGEIRLELRSDDDNDVVPFEARATDSGDAVTVASYGLAVAPGFSLAAAYADQDFSLVIEDPETGEPAGCGDILEAESDDFVEVGVALVQINPTGEDGGAGLRRGAAGGHGARAGRDPHVLPGPAVRAPRRLTADHPRRHERHDWTHRPHGSRQGRDGPAQRPPARLRPGAHGQGRPGGAVRRYRDR